MRALAAAMTLFLVTTSALAANPTVENALKVLQDISRDPVKMKTFCEMMVIDKKMGDTKDPALEAQVEKLADQLGPAFKAAWNAIDDIEETRLTAKCWLRRSTSSKTSARSRRVYEYEVAFIFRHVLLAGSKGSSRGRFNLPAPGQASPLRAGGGSSLPAAPGYTTIIRRARSRPRPTRRLRFGPDERSTEDRGYSGAVVRPDSHSWPCRRRSGRP